MSFFLLLHHKQDTKNNVITEQVFSIAPSQTTHKKTCDKRMSFCSCFIIDNIQKIML